MRLTKAMKEEIVSSILRDVPKVDHTDKIEMLAKNICFRGLPAELQTAAKTIPEENLYSGLCWSDVVVGINTHINGCHDRWIITLQDHPELAELIAEHKASHTAYIELAQEVAKHIYACKKVKQFEQRYPELVKYLDKPVVHAGLPTFPLTDMLTKAGWTPK